MDPANGRTGRTGIPANAIIAGTDADDVAWQAACPLDCSLHVTDVRGGPDTQIALPPHTVIDPDDTSDFDRQASASSCRWTPPITRAPSRARPSTSRTSAPAR